MDGGEDSECESGDEAEGEEEEERDILDVPRSVIVGDLNVTGLVGVGSGGIVNGGR